MSRRLPLLIVVATLLALVPQPLVGQSSYDVSLPAELTSGPDLCALAPCRDVMPGADRFSLRKGRPTYVEAYGTSVKSGSRTKAEADARILERPGSNTRKPDALPPN